MKSIQIHIIFFILLLFTASIHSADYPTANFSADVTSGSPPLTVQFTDLSTGEINYWEWDFDGDGVIDSTEQNPSFVYSDEGTYTVSLYVSGPWGENRMTKTDYITVEVRLPPGSPGTIKWELDIIDDIIGDTQLVTSPAIGADGTIYLGASTPKEEGLYAINSNGEILWSYQTDGPTYDIGNPTIDGNTVYSLGGHAFRNEEGEIESEGYLYAFNLDGSLKLKVLFPDRSINGLLSIGPNGTIYFSSFIQSSPIPRVNLLTAINSDGTERWAVSSLSPITAKSHNI
ncbi:MAG TPA: PKD domain-containing protein [Deltaproteobacteria bacterium]|nr:PKD domain-containing protein [Deltaproteobacteria bacterium]